MRRPSACFKLAGHWRLRALLAITALLLLTCWPIPALAQDAQAGAESTALPQSEVPVSDAPPWLPVGPPVPPELLPPPAPPDLSLWPRLPQLPPAPAPEPLPPAAPVPLKPHRVLLVGDSLMQNGCLGSQLEARFKHCPDVTVARWAKESTGLSRKDFFDWAAKLKELCAKHQPDLIVAVWGANDCQSVTNARGNALAVFGTDAWDSAYGARVEEVTAVAHAAGAQLVIIGLPRMRNEKYGARIARLNAVVQEHSAVAGGVYLPTWDITSTPAGACLASVKYNGKTVTMRQKDGIHLSNGGAGYVSDWLMGELGKVFTLTP